MNPIIAGQFGMKGAGHAPVLAYRHRFRSQGGEHLDRRGGHADARSADEDPLRCPEIRASDPLDRFDEGVDLATKTVSLEFDIDQVPARWRLLTLSTHQDGTSTGTQQSQLSRCDSLWNLTREGVELQQMVKGRALPTGQDQVCDLIELVRATQLDRIDPATRECPKVWFDRPLKCQYSRTNCCQSYQPRT